MGQKCAFLKNLYLFWSISIGLLSIRRKYSDIVIEPHNLPREEVKKVSGGIGVNKTIFFTVCPLGIGGIILTMNTNISQQLPSSD